MAAEDLPGPVFWADKVADRIEARQPDKPIVIKGGISPSGIPHLGNANEIVLGYFVAEVLRERGHEVRQVFTADDRDPLRKLPRKLADRDGTIVDLGDVDAGALGRNLGKPYTDIPDPFGCCASYGEHFSSLIQAIADDLAIPIELISTTALYESGALEPITRTVLEREERVREVLAEFQDKVDASYVPFNPICSSCGKITETVTDVNLEAGTVAYRCTDLEIASRTIEGCGHDGTAALTEGKLPWRLEWVAQWAHLGVDFEPFGKDHAEGSWPSGVALAKEVLAIEPPEPMVYEWFTYEGEPFSSSTGHVVMVSDVLQLVEPEVLKFFFSKDPARGRDFSIERIDLLVDEFDAFEAAYFGERTEPEVLVRRAERIYPFLVEEARAERVRLPYTFAAVLSMTDDEELQRQIARREGHLPEGAPEWAIEAAIERVERAGRWAALTDNRFNYELKRDTVPDVEFDPAIEAALEELADVVASGADGEAIQGAFFETARANDIPPRELFTAGYRLLFDEETGPKLGPFLAELDRSFVVERLRREG